LILVIANPNAGYLKANETNKNLTKIHQILGDFGHVLLTQTTEELQKALDNYKLNPPSVIVPFGGDGTISALLSAAAKVWGENAIPPIFPVHAGTMNMVASDVYPRKKPLQALRWLMNHQLNVIDQCTPRYPIKAFEHYGFVFGFGLPVNFMHAYYKLGSGPLAAIKLIAIIAWGIVRHNLFTEQLFSTIQGTEYRNGNITPVNKFSWQVCLALSIRSLPLRFNLSTSGGQQAKQEICLISGTPNKLALVLNLWRIWTGKMPSSIKVDRTTIDSIKFEFDTPTAWQLDGDIHKPVHTIQISAAPAVMFLALK
jgi:diacylglycerol kinase family enzyme